MASPPGDSNDEAGSAPKLDTMSRNESFGPFDGLRIVGAIHRFKPGEMAVEVNEICPVFRHSFRKGAARAGRQLRGVPGLVASRIRLHPAVGLETNSANKAPLVRSVERRCHRTHAPSRVKNKSRPGVTPNGFSSRLPVAWFCRWDLT